MQGFVRNAAGARQRGQGARRGWARLWAAIWTLGRDTRGASLGEFVILLGLVGIVGLVALPKLGSASNNKVKYTATCGLLNTDCGQGSGSGPSAQAQAAQAAQADLSRTARLDAAVATATPTGDGNDDQGGFWNSVGNGLNTALNTTVSVGKGFVVDGAWGTVTGLYNAATHPIDTVTGIVNAASHPIDSFNAIKDGVVTAWNEDPARLIGAGIFEVVTLPVAAAKAGKLTKLTRIAEELDNVVDAGKVADKVEDFAGAGKVLPKGPGVSGLPRKGSALEKTDKYHAFPDIVDNFSRDATRFEIPTKGPGGQVVRNSELYQVEGNLYGRDGVIEWVVDEGAVTHRRFIPGGKITGYPNQVPGD